jgi:predicted phage-related endonuclease
MTITGSQIGRRHFIGGSDARIIMGQDEKALIRLWQEKRGEVGLGRTSRAPQLGLATEDLNRRWHKRNTGRAIIDVQGGGQSGRRFLACSLAKPHA